MLKIALFRMQEGMKDAKFLFLTAIIILAFIFNATVYSDRYRIELEDYTRSEAENSQWLEEASSNLQSLAEQRQHFSAPPSPIAFISEGGSRLLPNTIVLNAFGRMETLHKGRGNYRFTLGTEIDWTFIIGVLMTLLTIMVSYGVVSGDKRLGTLRLVLANPISRIKLFAGNYLGLLSIIVVALIVGILVNLLTFILTGGPPLTLEKLIIIGWTIVVSILCLSAFLLAGLAVSAMTGRPAVSLIILLVIWVLMVIAVPGITRLVAEQLQEVPSQQWVAEEQARVHKEIWANYPVEIGQFNGNPFEPQMPLRAKASQEIIDTKQRILDQAANAKINQVKLAISLSFVSPHGVFTDSIQHISNRGIHGLVDLRDKAEHYRAELRTFVETSDENDPDSGHLVYPDPYDWSVENNTFSQKEVPFSTVPRGDILWTAGGQADERPLPLWHILILVGYNLLAGLVAFIALLRYDPR